MAKSRIVPIHTGVYLKEILDELGLSQYRLAQSPRYWFHLQGRYDIDVAEDQVGSRVIREVRRSKAVA